MSKATSTPTTSAAAKPAKKKKGDDESELSPEDLELKVIIETCVTRIKDVDTNLQAAGLETLRKEIRQATSTMTSAPKPLKFLRPHYPALKECFATLPIGPNKTLLADIMSMLAVTIADDTDKNASLSFKLQGNLTDLESWGHEYVRNLAGEIGDEYNKRLANEEDVSELLTLADIIVPFHMMHNAEPDACDLLMEIGKLERILEHVDTKIPSKYERVCLYLISCANYYPEPEDKVFYRTSLEIYRRAGDYARAIQLCLKLGEMEIIQQIFQQCDSVPMKKQLAFILARQGTCSTQVHGLPEESEECEAINSILRNAQLSEFFQSLQTDLGVSNPKDPEEVYKSGSETRSTLGTTVDSARSNLASTFVNAFVNVASGKDALVTQEDKKWIFKNKDHGMMSAAASLGMILMWDVDEGLSQLDKYLYTADPYIKAGALLGIGIVNCTVRNEFDPAFALLQEHVDSPQVNLRLGSIMGIGLAYAGTARDDVMELLLGLVDKSMNNPELIGVISLALGMVFVGTANFQITDALMGRLLDAREPLTNSTYSRFIAVGLGLLYLGKGDTAEVALELAKVLQGSLGKYTTVTISTCAYAGSGNVLKVQQLLQICGEHAEEGAEVPPGPNPQGVAVLGIALIAMGEELGSAMAARTFDHLLQYGDPAVRRAVPLALGLLSVSNPQISIMDTLSKLTHDSDQEMWLPAIFALGLVGAGTNNSREGSMLQHLANYYNKEPSVLFAVRLAQGLLHLGKGTVTLSPFHSDRTLMNPVAMAGLLAVIHSCLDMKTIILGQSHYILFSMAVAMYPRMLMTFDDELRQIKTAARVGLAVDLAGQAGRPKAITGFQTHTTPVLLGHGDRAELATDDYTPLNPTLEGFVILKRNTPDDATSSSS